MSGRHRWAWLLLAYIGAAAGELVKVTCEIEDHRTVICEGVEYKSDSHDIPGSSEFYLHLSLCIFMVLFAGMVETLLNNTIATLFACWLRAPGRFRE